MITWRELASQFGAPEEGPGTAWKCRSARCAPVQEVKAVAAGQVVGADWLCGVGNLLIVGHGDGYLSPCGNHDGPLAPVGATVHEGDRVAPAEASGGSPERSV